MAGRFIIWGAGGHGRVVADIVRARFGESVELEYADRDPARLGSVAEPGGALIRWEQDELFARAERGEVEAALVLAVGHNEARLRVFERLEAGAELPAIVHPSAVLSPSASIGRASHVCPRVVVHPAAVVGRAVILNTGCIVEHDCRIGDGAHISPGAVLAGEVEVGERTWIGAGAVVINRVKIGRDVTVGAGAVVIRDVPDGVTVVGNPARVIKGGR